MSLFLKYLAGEGSSSSHLLYDVHCHVAISKVLAGLAERTTQHTRNQLREQTIESHRRPLLPLPSSDWRRNRGVQTAEHCSRCSFEMHVTRSTRLLFRTRSSRQELKTWRRGDRRRRTDFSAVLLEPEQRKVPPHFYFHLFLTFFFENLALFAHLALLAHSLLYTLSASLRAIWTRYCFDQRQE